MEEKLEELLEKHFRGILRIGLKSSLRNILGSRLRISEKTSLRNTSRNDLRTRMKNS